MGWVRYHGKALKKLTDRQVEQALVETASATKGEVLKQVPLDEGTLQDTVMWKVNPNNRKEVAISAGGGFGTPFTEVPYALKWHEQPANFQHSRKHNYIRDPVNNFTPRALKKVLTKKLSKIW